MKELLALCEQRQMALPKVARIHGKWIPLILSLPTFLFVRVAGQMLKIDPTVKTSMWWDFHHGKATEIEFLQGAVVDASKEQGLDTPVNSWLLKQIQALQIKHYRQVSMSGKEIRLKIWKSVSD